jgi:hypothetical protein
MGWCWQQAWRWHWEGASDYLGLRALDLLLRGTLLVWWAETPTHPCSGKDGSHQ